MSAEDRTWLLDLLARTAKINGDSSRAWVQAGSPEQAASHAGAANVCVEIADAVERLP